MSYKVIKFTSSFVKLGKLLWKLKEYTHTHTHTHTHAHTHTHSLTHSHSNSHSHIQLVDLTGLLFVSLRTKLWNWLQCLPAIGLWLKDFTFLPRWWRQQISLKRGYSSIRLQRIYQKFENLLSVKLCFVCEAFLFWDVTRRRLVAGHRRFGRTSWSHPQFRPETSVTIYQPTLHNILYERRPRLYRCGNLTSSV